ncbi:MAG: oxidoreductase [Rhizobiales bacterium]|nr:oxidoreductase [Hoeflea sp.]MBG18720.1 oxidoreductase [Hyphomicrobiales bacterium]|tara:strand:+ start:22042 stop:22524 length:483 start_codon:yes stop_codon:yes gene_type:complete
MKSTNRFLAVAAALAVAFFAQNSWASQVVLSLDGAVAGGHVDMTVDEIEALGVEKIETTTPWHDGKVVFEGVPLQRLLEKVGATGTELDIVALNDYRTRVPVEDAAKFGVILASRKEGQPMPVSDKGPLFVIYPFDKYPELRNEVYYSRSAWQVRSITVE